jgi:alkanesulfonate monooxygenase SsuD/methylene tetrahydromethanopterin reductase-like flavin-dependent oxidoreductase (luciferase family)
MKLGMTLPVTEPGWSRNILIEWVKRIEAGPFSSLALGERICFPNPELMTTLGACAVLTERLQLVTTVLILPMHDPVLTAKQLATVDVLSEGRLTVGVGTGGRGEDYRATGVDLSQKRIAVLESHVETMRRVWRGEIVVPDTLRPVEPFPLQEGGPCILSGAMGPKATANAAKWADGISGMTMSASPREVSGSFDLARQAWKEAGREEPPELNTALWFAIGDQADEQVSTHLTRYFNWIDPAAREGMIAHAGFRGSAEAFRDLVSSIAETGANELLLIPTSIDPNEVDRVADALGGVLQDGST